MVDLPHPSEYFNSLAQEINKGIRTEMLSEEEMNTRSTRKELEERERAKIAKRKIRLQLSKLISRITARKDYFAKLIEEQNLTAQEKLNNERNLIDLFF